MDKIYTPIEFLSDEISKRWKDEGLDKEILEYLGNDIPKFLISKPHLVLFRNIATPNNEINKIIDLSISTGLDFLLLEFHDDKFVAFNPDKYPLVILNILMGKTDKGKIRIYRNKVADIDIAQGKNFTQIETIWGESLIDFHHSILKKRFPETEGKIYDMSAWLKRKGERARVYYEYFICLLIKHCVLVECFNSKGDEERFMKEVFLPSFNKIQDRFKVKPLIVQLSPNDLHSDPEWWYPREEIKDIISEHVKEYKSNHA